MIQLHDGAKGAALFLRDMTTNLVMRNINILLLISPHSHVELPVHREVWITSGHPSLSRPDNVLWVSTTYDFKINNEREIQYPFHLFVSIVDIY